MRKLIKTFDYGTVPNSYDILKCIALITMVIDHTGHYLFPGELWFRVIGRAAFPIFLFLVGYSRSTQFDLWLLIGAMLVFLGKGITGMPLFPLYILFAIMLWRSILGWMEKRPHWLQDMPVLWVAMLLFYVPSMMLVEYGTLGLMFAVLGWHTRQGRNDLTLRVTWLFTLFFWVTMQSMNFGFDMAQVCVFIFIAVSLVITLMHFSVQEHPLPPQHKTASPTWLEAAVILCARNTLLLYVLHVLALQAAMHVIHPDMYQGFFVLWRLH